MKRKNSAISIGLFILTTIYSCYGILQLGRQGGPCNAGLAIIVLTPFLLLCVGLISASLVLSSTKKKRSLTKPLVFSTISLSIWTFLFLTFLKDSAKESILYLGLFEVFNIYLIINLLYQEKRNK
jgi:hypothetical protein